MNESKDILRKSNKYTCTVSMEIWSCSIQQCVWIKGKIFSFWKFSIFQWSKNISGILWIFLQPPWLICTAGRWRGTRLENRTNGLLPAFLWQGLETHPGFSRATNSDQPACKIVHDPEFRKEQRAALCKMRHQSPKHRSDLAYFLFSSLHPYFLNCNSDSV